MPYLLDGNNLIGRARGRARPTQEDASSLVAEVAARLRRTRASAVLFFDGGGETPPVSLGSLTVRYAGPRSADDAIVAAIGRARTPREVVVVTADRGLARRARDAGAGCVSPEEFWARFGVAPESGSSREAPKVDVEEWMRYFGDERNRSS